MASESTNTRLNWGLSPIAYDGSRTPEKAVLFLVLCMAWILPGLVGHDPWKSDEAIVFGAVTEMLKSGDWIAFRVAGGPLPEKPAAHVWVAAGPRHLSGGWLALHD